MIVLDVEEFEAATFIRRFLKHKEFNAQAKRLGKVIRVTRRYISVRHRYSEKGVRIAWAD